MKTNEFEFVGVIKEDSTLFFSAWNGNAFLKYDLKSGRIKNALVFNEDILTYSLYAYPIRWRNNAILFPVHGKYIQVISLDEFFNKEYLIDFYSTKTYCSQFRDAYVIDDKLYMTPYFSHALGEFDIKNEKIQYYGQFFHCLEKYYGVENQHICSKAVVRNREIWFASTKINVLICFDTVSKDTHIYRVGIYEHGFDNVIYNGKDFFIVSKNNLIRWNNERGIIQEINNVFGDGNVGSFEYFGGKIWFVEEKGRFYATYDLNSGIVNKYDIQIKQKDRYHIGYIDLLRNGYELNIFPNLGNLWIKIDMLENNINSYVLRCVQEDKEMLLKKSMEKIKAGKASIKMDACSIFIDLLKQE